MTTLTFRESCDKFPLKTLGGMNMKGGVYLPAGRKHWRVWYPWKGRVLYFSRYLDGSPLYDERQATRVLEKIRGEVDQGSFDPANWGKDKTLLFENAWKVYQDQATCGEVRKRDRERIHSDYFSAYFEKFYLSEIEEHHVKDWFSKLPDKAPSYKRMIRATLRAFLNFHAVTRRKQIRFPMVTVPRKSPLWLSQEEQERVFREIPDHHKGIFRFMLTYGCRSSEVCNLRRSDIDWEKGTFTLKERKNNQDNSLPILPEVEKYLVESKLLDGQERGRGETRGRSAVSVDTLNYAPPYSDNLLKGQCTPNKIMKFIYIFTSPRGSKYRRQTLYWIWQMASKKAGVKCIALKNATRHSKACQLLNRGIDIPAIARILGNSTRVVEQSYGRVSTERVGEVLTLRKVEG